MGPQGCPWGLRDVHGGTGHMSLGRLLLLSLSFVASCLLSLARLQNCCRTAFVPASAGAHFADRLLEKIGRGVRGSACALLLSVCKRRLCISNCVLRALCGALRVHACACVCRARV
jgi:hypothetical protein